MSIDIYKEIDVFLKAIFLGAGLSIIYDIFRILRRIHKKGSIITGTIITGIEDLIFFIFSSVIIFSFMYNMNGGIIRAYIFVGIFIGIFIYEEAFGKYVVKYVSKFIKKILCLLKKCLQPFKILLGKCICNKRGAKSEKKKKRKKKERSEQT